MGKRKMRGFKKGKFNLHCFIYGHRQNKWLIGNNKRFRCSGCGATWDGYAV